MSITWFFSIVSHLPGIHLNVVFPFPQYFPANTSKRGFWQLLFFIVTLFHFSMWIVYIFTNLKNHDISKRSFSSTHTLSKMHLNVVVSVAQISSKIHPNVVFVDCYFLLSLFTFFLCEKFTFLIDLKNQNTSKRGFLSVYSFSTNTSKRGRKTI